MTLPIPKYYWNFNESLGDTFVDAIAKAPMRTDDLQHGADGKGLRFRKPGGATYGEMKLPEIKPPWTAALQVMREGKGTNEGASALLSSASCSIRLEQWDNANVQVLGLTRFSKFDRAFTYQTPLGQWAHLTLVGTAADTKLYVNGQLAGTLPASIELGLDYLGAEAGFRHAPSVVVDELKIFDQELTAQHAKELYEEATGAGLEVWVDGQAAKTGGSKDLGVIAAGQSKAAAVVIQSPGAKVTHAFKGGGGSVTSALPAASPATYAVTLEPSGAGRAEATLTIKSDDPAVAPFTFTIFANGGGGPVGPPGPPPSTAALHVLWKGSDAGNARTYEIGPVTLGSVAFVETTVTLQNGGKDTLTYSLDGADARGLFTVPRQVDRALASGKSDDHVVRFAATTVGRWAVLINVTSDDPNLKSFYFWLMATVTPA